MARGCGKALSGGAKGSAAATLDAAATAAATSVAACNRYINADNMTIVILHA